MIRETFTVGPLACNCTILADEESRRALVIDPGGDPEAIRLRLERLGLTLEAMIATHAHIDHVGAVWDLQEATGAWAAIHRDDLFLYEHLADQARWLGLPPPRAGNIGRFLDHGQAISSSGINIAVLHTPGHTPGSLTFHFNDDGPILFTGDTLFLNSVGRTDLWGGSIADLLASIRERLFAFADDTRVVPGHGPTTTIGRERRENPFLR